MCLSLLPTPGSFSRHPKWPAVCRTSMRPSTRLKSRPTTALICTRTSPAASNHVKSTSANQIETRDFIFFLPLNAIKHTWESRKLERWTDFGFLFFFSHTPHTFPYLHYSNRHLGTSVVLINITFCQTFWRDERDGAGGVILGHRCLGPSDTHQEGEGHPPAVQGPLRKAERLG